MVVKLQDILEKKLKTLEEKVATKEDLAGIKEDLKKHEDKLREQDDVIAMLRQQIQALKKQQINQEQYSRRTSLRLLNIKTNNDETADDCLVTVRNIIKKYES